MLCTVWCVSVSNTYELLYDGYLWKKGDVLSSAYQKRYFALCKPRYDGDSGGGGGGGGG